MTINRIADAVLTHVIIQTAFEWLPHEHHYVKVYAAALNRERERERETEELAPCSVLYDSWPSWPTQYDTRMHRCSRCHAQYTILHYTSREKIPPPPPVIKCL